MNIRDEIDAMLDNLKSGSPSSAPRNNTAPKTYSKQTPASAPRKTVYDNMSVDDILSALSGESKKQAPKTKTAAVKPSAEIKKSAPTAPEPAAVPRTASAPKPAERRQPVSSKDSVIPENLLNMLSGASQSEKKENTVQSRKAAVSRIKAAIENAEEVKAPAAAVEESFHAEDTASDETEITADTHDSSDEVIANDISDVNEEETDFFESFDDEAEIFDKPYEASEPSDDDYSEAEEIEEESFYEEEEDSSDLDEAAEEQKTEAAPEKPKKGFLAGLKTLFSKKEKKTEETAEDTSTQEEAEESDISPDDEYISEAAEETAETETISDYEEETSDSVISEEESVSADDDSVITDDALIADNSGSSEITSVAGAVEAYEEAASLETAAELVDAALAAIEEELNPENTDFESSDSISKEASANSESATEEDAAEELIADIRENAANAIAELESDNDENDESDTENSEADSDDNVSDEAAAEVESSDSSDDEVINIDVSVGNIRKKGRITAALEEILNEDPGVISDERSEKPETDSLDISIEKKGSGKLKRNLYAVFGVLVTVFAVLGVVFAVRYISGHFRSFTAGENKKDIFAEIIYPAVIMDIESFNNPSELSSEQVISAALWSLVMSEEDMSKYDSTFDIITVPAIDAEAYAAELFGGQLPAIEHKTVGSGELKFYYNSETKSYNVPVNPITFTYKPVINSVSKNGNEYILNVDYYTELPAWITEKENFTPEVSKTVEFKLVADGESYTIDSMTVLSVNEVA